MEFAVSELDDPEVFTALERAESVHFRDVATAAKEAAEDGADAALAALAALDDAFGVKVAKMDDAMAATEALRASNAAKERQSAALSELLDEGMEAAQTSDGRIREHLAEAESRLANLSDAVVAAEAQARLAEDRRRSANQRVEVAEGEEAARESRLGKVRAAIVVAEAELADVMAKVASTSGESADPPAGAKEVTQQPPRQKRSGKKRAL
jgi:chromosome segregation ATPase